MSTCTSPLCPLQGMLETETRCKNGRRTEVAFLSGSEFGEPGGTTPPRISRSICNLNSRAVIFRDLLILFYLSKNK